MNKIACGLKGRYKLQAVNAKSGLVTRETPWFDNLITDPGLNAMGLGSVGPGVYCMVGAGSSTPLVTDTALQAQIAYTQTYASNLEGVQGSTAPYYRWGRRTYRFGVGVAAGNLSEVGVGWTSTLVFSRARILDGSGNPTTITVLSDEYLDVLYELQVYQSTDDTTFSVDIGGVTYSVKKRAMSVNSVMGNGIVTALQGGINAGFAYGSCAMHSGPIGTIFEGPSGTSGSVTSVTARAYVNNSLQRIYDFFCDLGEANQDIKSMSASANLGQFQFEFTPTIPKNNTKRLNIPVQFSWSRRA